MPTTVVQTSKCSAYYEGNVSIVGYFTLVWDEQLIPESKKSILKWKLVMNIISSSSGNYGRSVAAYTNGIKIGNNSYNIPSGGSRYFGNGDIVTSGQTEIVHDEDGTKYVDCSVTGKIGGDTVYGESKKFPLTRIDTTPVDEDILPTPVQLQYHNFATPVLYDSSDWLTIFDQLINSYYGNGIGRLTGTVSCIVTEEINGVYEMEMEIVTGSQFYDEIKIGRIIAVPTGIFTFRREPFEIYSIEKDLGGITRVRGQHISYRLSYVFYKGSGEITLRELFNNLKNKTGDFYGSPGFDWTLAIEDTDETSQYAIRLYKPKDYLLDNVKIDVSVPRSIRNLLGPNGVLGAIDEYKANNNINNEDTIEYEWAMGSVNVAGKLGSDMGAEIRYGKNMTDMRFSEDSSGAITGYLPIWNSVVRRQGEQQKHLVGSVQLTTNTEYLNIYGYDRVAVYDCSEFFKTEPTIQQLNDKAKADINDLTKLKLVRNIEVNYADIFKSIDYTNGVDYSEAAYYESSKMGFDNIQLGDDIAVIYNPGDVYYKARIVQTRYDVINNRLDSFQVGEPKQYIVSKVQDNMTEIQKLEAARKQFETETSFIVEEELNKELEHFENTVQHAQDAADAARDQAEAARQEAEKAGEAIVRDTLYYLATDKYENVTDTEYGWTSTPQSMTPEKPYLWTYHYYEKANLTGYNSTPVITGVYGLQGPPGATIARFEMLHMRSNSTTIPAKPTVQVTEQGLDISNIWSLNTPKWNKSYPYYYICSQILFTDGTYSWSQPLADTSTEEMLRNAIVSITNQYYTSTSSTELAGGSGWFDNYNDAILKMATEASKEEGGRSYYIWARQKTIKADDSISYGEPYYDSSLTTTTEQSARLNVLTGSIQSEVAAVTRVQNEDHQTIINNTSAIVQLPSQISQSVISALTGEDGDITKATKRIQSAEEIIDTITTTYPEDIKAAKDDSSSALNKVKTLETYIKHTSRGVEVSDSQSPSTGVFGPSSLDYYINNSVVASFGTEKTIVANELDIGVSDANGWRMIGKGAHLTFTRRQG